MVAFTFFSLMFIGLLLPLETRRIKTLEHGLSLSLAKRTFIAAAATCIAFTVFSIVLAALIYGPTYIKEDFIFLSYLTSLPALIIAGWVASKVSKAITNAFVNNFAAKATHG